MTYGVPYKGSKNRIATLIMNELPAGTRFVDLMAGGCAMTHAAMLSGKYDKVLCNDKYPHGSNLFKNALNGEFNKPEYLRWVSREEFLKEKDTDDFVKFCYSFGNNGKDYMYSEKLEPLKKAFHYAVVYDDWTYLEQYSKDNNWREGLLESLKKSVEGIDTTNERRLKLQRVVLKNQEIGIKTSVVENLWCLNRIQNLELATEQQIEFASFDYRDYEHEECDVVYCDPPYIGAAKYDGREFDHAEFWNWVRTRDYPVYVSEYNAPDDFTCIWQKAKLKLAAGGRTAKQKAIEHLYIHRKWLNGEIERIVEQIVENTGNGGK